MVTFSAQSSADPAEAWALMARPSRWSEWAPHIRGAWRLGSQEVQPGAVGAVRLLGFVPVPAQIVAKRAGRLWAWRVGPAVLVHRIEPLAGGGCEVAIDIWARPAGLESALAATYGRLVDVLVGRLARVAEEA
jgi:Polyketide cyclase / dehydrase and lipid transport